MHYTDKIAKMIESKQPQIEVAKEIVATYPNQNQQLRIIQQVYDLTLEDARSLIVQVKQSEFSEQISEKYQSLKDAGVSVEELFDVAQKDGLDRMEAIHTIMILYNLSLIQALEFANRDG